MTELSADRPSTDPKEDLFGHAPFAKILADGICGYPGNDGLVFALYGPWGSGKSTVLGYINYYIEQQPEKTRPIVVPFNPWWFSGQENLARAFLGQLQAVLPDKSEKFKKLGDLLGDFTEGVGGLIDLSGITGGFGGPIGKIIGRAVKWKPKDVPAIKAKISKILNDTKKRILVIVDDIDRLTPDEIRQLFTVIKALADFPNTAYLLAFDREVATEAIKQQTGLPGEQYLEKIIQVPFEFPSIDRLALRAALFKRLSDVLGNVPAGTFYQSYWANVYHDGVDALIQIPRDVIRLTNTLAVTYPAVRGEVNVADFIALEAIRVFQPHLYDIIRNNPDKFSGSIDFPDGGLKKKREEFHASWRSSLPERFRDNVNSLMERIFPKTGNTGYGSNWLTRWRRELRACHPDIFPIYFRLTMPQGTVRRDEVMKLLELVGTPAEFCQVLICAKTKRNPNGISKTCALLERLKDHVENDIPENFIAGIIQALLNRGDLLIDSSDENDSFNFGNDWHVASLVYHLLKRLPMTQCTEILEKSIKHGNAILVQSYILEKLDKEVTETKEANGTILLTEDKVANLKAIWVERVQVLSDRENFVDHPKLSQVLAIWRTWGDATKVRAWCDHVTMSDEELYILLLKFLTYQTSQVIGEWAVQRWPRLNPKWLENYLDIADCVKRLGTLTATGMIPDTAKEAVSQFLKEFGMLNTGNNPDGFGAFDYEKNK